tara:strand:+ start:1046 stop:1255 length:210 start_codon:yes stop_codon:yes gene_type:complete
VSFSFIFDDIIISILRKRKRKTKSKSKSKSNYFNTIFSEQKKEALSESKLMNPERIEVSPIDVIFKSSI